MENSETTTKPPTTPPIIPLSFPSGEFVDAWFPPVRRETSSSKLAEVDGFCDSWALDESDNVGDDDNGSIAGSSSVGCDEERKDGACDG